MADIELFHAEPASNSLKVLQALYEKGVPFTGHRLNLSAFEQHDPAFLAINPAGQVPALRHGGRVLTESTVINEYIDETFAGPALSPTDPWLRAEMRGWTKYVDEVFRPALSNLAWSRMIPALAARLPEGEFEARLARIPLPEKRAKWALAASGGFAADDLDSWRRQLSETVDRVEAALERRDWLVGDRFTLADIAVFAMSNGMTRSYPELINPERTPRASAWIDRMRARPGVAQALAA